MFKANGRIVYDPPRPGLKLKRDWWCILDIINGHDLCRYYRWWVYRQYMIDLVDPAWGAHVSIIRGERPNDDKMNLWKKYNGQKVDFNYSHNVRWAGDKTGVHWRDAVFWFVDVDAPHLLNIRKEMDKPYDWNLHLTIGRIRQSAQ